MRNPTAAELHAIEQVYAQVRQEAAQLRQANAGAFVAFAILHSRVFIDPALLVVGDRPNLAEASRPGQRPNDLDDPVDPEQEQVPVNDKFSLWRGDYNLALMTTALFARADRLELLKHAQFFDTNFFAKSAVQGNFDQHTEAFCHPHVVTLIRTINPLAIVTIGEAAFRKLVGPNQAGGFLALLRGGTASYVCPGLPRPIPVTPIVHPSAASRHPDHLAASIEGLRGL